MQAVKDIWLRRELLQNLTVRNLKIRYKNSFFGFFWTLLNPLFMILVYMVFIGIMRFPIDLPYLITGVIPWHFFTMCIGDSINVIEGNSSLIKKTSFPRMILPLSTLSANTINFMLSLSVVALLVPVLKWISGGSNAYQFNVLFFFPAILLHFLLTSGLVFLVGVSNVYFKDTEHLVSVILMAWFFMSPIIYPLSEISKIEEQSSSVIKLFLLKLYYMNPMVLILSLYRKAFLDTPLPWNMFTTGSLVITVIIFSAGLSFFRKKEPFFADEM